MELALENGFQQADPKIKMLSSRGITHKAALRLATRCGTVRVTDMIEQGLRLGVSMEDYREEGEG